MIEQTDLVVNEWIYMPPAGFGSADKINTEITLEVMKKTAPEKKGLACRFTFRFHCGKDPILLYVAQDSYVIDLEDKINATDVHTMLRNSYSKFKETFDLRKLGTILQNRSLIPLNEAGIDVDAILPLLN